MCLSFANIIVHQLNFSLLTFWWRIWARGQHSFKGNLYECPTSSPYSSSTPQAYNTTTSPTSLNNCHRCLDHPNRLILWHVISSHSLSMSKSSLDSCNSCLCNKSNWLSFGASSLISSKPLKLIYNYIWGLPPITSLIIFYIMWFLLAISPNTYGFIL